MNRDWLEGWKGQYKRIIRWSNRLNISIQNGDSDEIFDFTYAFFQSCYHLRDWLVADGVATKQEMNDFIESNIELQLCRDICNATKHLQYNKPSIEPKPRIGRELNYFGEISGYYLYSNKRYPITELMYSCIKIWEIYLNSKGLLNA